MSSKPEIKYSPGELQKVRQNLGFIPDCEAKRMAELLGGEIGIEQNNNAVEQKYGELHRTGNKVQSGSIKRYRTSASNMAQSGCPEPPPNKDRNDVCSEPLQRLGYLDRVKMDFLASEADFNLKARGNAIASLFSFFIPVPDLVNRVFIQSAEARFFANLKKLVLSVRLFLPKKNHRLISLLKKEPFYFRILTIVSHWEIEEIERILVKLKSQNRVCFSECRDLCRMIFAPLIMLSELDPGIEIIGAIQYAYNKNKILLPKGGPGESRLKDLYYISQNTLFPVLNDLKFTLFPLLLKSCSPTFYPYGEFYSKGMVYILPFINLNNEEILLSSDMYRKEISKVEGPAAENSGNPNEDDAAPAGPETETEKALPESVEKGIAILSLLFPCAGFDRLQDFPDLYSYFHPLYLFPKGIELIPPDDPLIQITIFITILNDLFYGFGGILFNILRDREGNQIDLPDSIEDLLMYRHLSIDEIIVSEYLNLLREYCRQTERISNFRESEYGKRIDGDLQWLKKMYFLPAMNMKLVTVKKPPKKAHIPDLTRYIKGLKSLLSQVIANMYNEYEPSICNPDEKYRFELPNPVSARLDSILLNKTGTTGDNTSIIDNRTNCNLIKLTFSIVHVLDHYLSSENCHFYRPAPKTVFRSVNNEGRVPEYSVRFQDTYSILHQKSKPTEQETDIEDRIDELTGFYTPFSLKLRLKSLIDEFHNDKCDFYILAADIRGFTEFNALYGHERGDRLLLDIAVQLKTSLNTQVFYPYRLRADDFIIIIPGTVPEGLPAVINTILSSISKIKDDRGNPISLCVTVVPFYKTWGSEKLLKMAHMSISAIKESSDNRPRIYNGSSDELEIFI
jgi:diguanylate cyclase (GGDEF)-like protein